MSIGTLAIVAAVAFVIWGIYELIKDMRGPKTPPVVSSVAAPPPSKWTAGRIFAYIALTPVFLLCLFVALFFLVSILVPFTCSGGVCTSPLDSFGISLFGLGWIVGLFLLPLCLIVIPLAGGIVLLFRPSIAGKVIGVILLLGFVYFAWQFRMLWFPIVGIGPSSAEISAMEAQQEIDVEAKRQAWIQSALRSEDSCRQSVTAITPNTIDMIDDIDVDDFSLNTSEIRFIAQGGRNQCLFLVDANLTKDNTRFRQQYIFDITTMEFSYAGEPLLLRDPVAYRKEITSPSPRVEQSDNFDAVIKAFR